MNDITAYFVGGPKHGDIDIVRGDARDVRIPVTGETRRQAIRDMGHYGYVPTYSPNYDVGVYERQHELYGMPGMNTSRRNFLFMWSGVR